MHAPPLVSLALVAAAVLGRGPVQDGADPALHDPQAAPQEAPVEVAAGSPAVRVLLGGGGQLVGQRIKETGEAIFIDIGFTIVSVPRSEIVAIEEEGAVPAADGRGERGGLYSVGGGQRASVRDNVDRLGEAAVLVRVPSSLGSGFVIDPEGWIVTNAHVIAGEQQISVTVFEQAADGELEKRVFDGVELVALNEYWDLALLRIPAEDLEDFELVSVPLGRAEDVVQGEPVFALGNPMGLERTVSEGIVSATNRAIGGMLYLQTTAAINPGNSGGALFNLRGEVVGVNTLKGWGEGLGFSVPVSTLKTFLDNRDAFAFDKERPNNGFRYPPPPPKTARKR